VVKFNQKLAAEKSQPQKMSHLQKLNNYLEDRDKRDKLAEAALKSRFTKHLKREKVAQVTF
jgi:hypothetical protein